MWLSIFAAFSIVSESMQDPFKYDFNNTINTTSLIKCAVETGVHKFIFSSTAAVYGDVQQNRKIKRRFSHKSYKSLWYE